MIDIKDKNKCCGCTACYNVCPKNCISMSQDVDGFLYPVVDETLCIDCHLCEKVCPFQMITTPRLPIFTYAAKANSDEIRNQSSSGGVFTILAEAIIAKGGVVFGARFDSNWTVVHGYSETFEGLASFRGAKYAQSVIGDSFKEVRNFLKAGRYVLFSGTSCQIAGLIKFLNREYNNLITVEILCHGVPSPLVLTKYLNSISRGKHIRHINFRNKDNGWSNYSYQIKIEFDDGTQYLEPSSGRYIKSFTSNLSTRPSCSCCPSKGGRSNSDFLLGDCWGVWNFLPLYDDNKGVSLVLAYSNKANEFLKKIKIEYREIKYTDALKFNPVIEKSSTFNDNSNSFFKYLKRNVNINRVIDSFLPAETKFGIVNKYLSRLVLRIIK